ncbi:tricarboxylic transporter [Actinopolyspora erythraea]|uniref:Tricarboxylic transport membrane protein n=1 Tax=Actinopolyspora erythraea TaxID=414996 RepID=A0A099D3D5_9ACTN|nr:tripartite tricarboxylate transporter substrate-binding protein [Actinopolyspora erythraea]ASU77876.1 tricarboxylic transporter [Actinopolyspora erythraea]KGI79860.1 tricarboxylic transport membrane protein [Actinopolyspora erythraea]
MTGRLILRLTAAVLGVVVVGAGLADAHTKASGGTGPRDKLRLIAPADPGGGWDTVAREIQSSVDAHGLSRTTEVLNVPGAGGTIGLSRLANQSGSGNKLMMSGAVMTGAIQTTDSRTTLDDVTPIARLADDYEVVVVPKDSPFRTVEDLMSAWRRAPRSVALGGGSAGGTDHLFAGMLSRAAGVPTSELNYIAYSGGGEVVTGLLDGGLDVGVSSYAEFAGQIAAGELRALGVSAEEPLDGVDVPTFVEQGVDATLANWRGVVAPPGLSVEQRAELEEIVTRVHDTEQWRGAVERNGWEDTFQTGAEFRSFLESETARIKRISEELGLS